LILRTDAEGKYSIDPQIEPFAVVALHDQGSAQVTGQELKSNSRIVLRPWARIEGVVRVGSRPAAGERIAMSLSTPHEQNQPRIHFDYQAESDAQGRFVFDRVIPGEFTLTRMVSMGPERRMWSTASTLPVSVTSGQTLTVSLGGKGRPVTGRVVIPATTEQQITLGYGYNSLQREPTLSATIKRLMSEGTEGAQKKLAEWRNSEEGRTVIRRVRNYGFAVNADGTFHIDDVESGTYTLTIRACKPDPANLGDYRQTVGAVVHRFQVPEMPGGRSDEPLNLGDLPLTVGDAITSSGSMPFPKHTRTRLWTLGYLAMVIRMAF
jgi:hypothetical protein